MRLSRIPDLSLLFPESPVGREPVKRIGTAKTRTTTRRLKSPKIAYEIKYIKLD
jgi:hypothetical protein